MATTAPTRPAPSPLRTVREAQGYSLREIARRTGMDAAHLSRVERGEVGLSVSTLRRLAQALGLRDLARVLAQYDHDWSPVASERRERNPIAVRGGEDP